MFTQFSSIQLITKCGFGLTGICFILNSLFPSFSMIWTLLFPISIPMLMFGLLSHLGYLIINSKAKNEIISASIATNAAAFGVIIGGFLGFMLSVTDSWNIIPEHVWKSFENIKIMSGILLSIELLKISPFLTLIVIFINYVGLVNVDDMSLEELEKYAEELDKNEKNYEAFMNAINLFSKK